jgi:hypothetical protein|tara:strand:- start:2948 stop:3136 length:189 start_codon:yes stop_codon:yes gene_type:complete
MVKKVRLLDEDTTTAVAEEVTSTTNTTTELDTEKLMKFLEAIDWKLWELLKLERAKAGVETK